MRIPFEVTEQLIPEGFPDPELNFSEVNERAQSIENSLEKRSYLWANAILYRLSFPGFFDRDGVLPVRTSHVSAGFVYINKATNKDSITQFTVKGSFVFGAYALVNAEENANEQQVIPISIGQRVLPLVINYGRIQPHGCPTHPPGGTGCCWVEDTSGKGTWGKGILASRHVVAAYSLGSTISLSPSTSHPRPLSGTLADIDACTIDAAVIGIKSSDWPGGLYPLNINTAIAPGITSANFNGQFTATTGKVLRIFQYPIYYGNLFGQRIIADCYGIAGDSGTVLRDGMGNGMGIYIGEIPDGAGGKDGLFQDLKQVQHYYKLDLYY